MVVPNDHRHNANMSTTMTSPPTPPPAPPRPPLTRSQDERMLAGVAGGLAQRYGWDPALVRIVFVLIGLMSAGSGIVAYVIAWLVIPDEPERGSIAERTSSRGRLWLGAILLGLGIISLLDVLGLDKGPGRVLWPLMLIGAGVTLLVVRRAGELGDAEPLDTDQSSGRAGGPAAPGVNDDESTTLASAYESRGVWPTRTSAADTRQTGVESPVAPNRTRSQLTGLVWGVLFLYGGTLWLLDIAGALTIDPVAALAGALGIVGLGLIISSWIGKALGLIPLGCVLVVACTGFALIDVPFRGGIGERSHRPLTTAAIEPVYELAIGELELDLRQIALEPGERIEIDLTTGLGEIIVRLPVDTAYVIHGHADVGAVEVFGDSDSGGIDADRDVRAGDPTDGVFVIDARVGLGAVTIPTPSEIVGAAR
jgi:phage shock protein PspC (stress-responsive transcriptional regulator)